MNDSPQESQQDRIRRFKEAIWNQWKCDATPKGEEHCDLSRKGCGSGTVSVFELSGQPERHREAKQCFVWDGEKFKPGGNGPVVMLDVQVPSHDRKRLPELAVWHWCEDTFIKDSDSYVTSKWTKDKLDGMQVQYGKTDREPIEGKPYPTGKFFVRDGEGGKIAVRIIQPNNKPLRLEANEIERITLLPDSNSFWVTLS
jgi:hypothetical protein